MNFWGIHLCSVSVPAVAGQKGQPDHWCVWHKHLPGLQLIDQYNTILHGEASFCGAPWKAKAQPEKIALSNAVPDLVQHSLLLRNWPRNDHLLELHPEAVCASFYLGPLQSVSHANHVFGGHWKFRELPSGPELCTVPVDDVDSAGLCDTQRIPGRIVRLSEQD